MNFNAKLSKKNTIIAIVLVSVFVVFGILGAILGHIVYLNGREAKIVNYSVRENAALHLRKDGALSYRYEEGLTLLDLNAADLIILSDGATKRILRVVDEDETVLPSSAKIDLSAHPHVYVFLRVISEGAKKQTDYLLEIVPRSQYQEDRPFPSITIDDSLIIS